MINAESFVEAARNAGFIRYTGVPCSFLTPFINYVINDEKLEYISSSNEGDALATAAGAVIGGERAITMMQNSGLGNAVSPITSLNYVFRIPVLIITTHRGAVDIQDEPQHELMGKITSDLFDTMQVPWEIFPTKDSDIQAALDRAIDYMDKEKRPYALIMKKGSIAAHALKSTVVTRRRYETVKKQFQYEIERDVTRGECLQRIIEKTPEKKSVIIATTGYTGRELFAINDRSNHLYMVGSMGCASSLALGLALARPDLTVIAIDGDGAALMRLGNFATIGSYAQSNFRHLLLDNGVHDSTGAQKTVSANVDFSGIAASCGYGLTCKGDVNSVIDEVLTDSTIDGPVFGHIKTVPGTIDNLPRPHIAPVDVLNRLTQHIRST